MPRDNARERDFLFAKIVAHGNQLLLLRLQLVDHFADFEEHFAGNAFRRELFEHQ